MSENICSNCSLPIYADAIHVCVGTSHTYSETNFPMQQIRLFPTFEPLVYTQTQADERTRAVLRDLIDERDSLLDDLDATLDEVYELRADLEAVCGDLKLSTEREEARKQLKKSLPLIKQYFDSPGAFAVLAEEGKYIDFKELLQMFKDVGEESTYYTFLKPIKPEFVGETEQWTKRIINRFQTTGRSFVVTLDACVYEVLKCGSDTDIHYALVAQL